MTTPHVPEPELPDGITPGELDAEARRDLRGLQKDTADVVAKHLVAAGMLVDEDPERALEHARFARRRASRIAVVREAAGIAAYHAGEWNEALGELRAARRMGGGPGHLAVMADIERALGRPERALDLVRAPEAKELGRAETIELAIVASGARRDLGELDAAVVGLQIPELDPTRRDAWSPRLFYAYADNLLAAGRESDALQWFVHTVNADTEGETDAEERIADLTGEPLDDGGVVFQGENEVELAESDVEEQDIAEEGHGTADTDSPLPEIDGVDEEVPDGGSAAEDDAAEDDAADGAAEGPDTADAEVAAPVSDGAEVSDRAEHADPVRIDSDPASEEAEPEPAVEPSAASPAGVTPAPEPVVAERPAPTPVATVPGDSGAIVSGGPAAGAESASSAGDPPAASGDAGEDHSGSSAGNDDSAGDEAEPRP